MENWINLDNLPRRKDGKIDWKNCNNNKVEFNFDGINNYFTIIKRTKRHHVLIDYEDKRYEINTDSLLTLHLESFVRLSKVYTDKINSMINIETAEDNEINEFAFCIGDIIDSIYGKAKIISQLHFICSRVKGYNIFLIDENEIILVTEYEILNNIRVNRFNKKGIIIGVNDLWTTKPSVAKLLLIPDLGHIYPMSSNEKVDIVCSECHNIVHNKPIRTLSFYSFSCPLCGDEISFPNKLMVNILQQLKISFDTENTFSWCVFPDYKNPNKVYCGRYDIIVPNQKLIIEMDGGIGHGNKPHGKSNKSKEELMYIDEQKDRLAFENGYALIRINCNYKNNHQFDYCKENIIKCLSSYFDFNKVDWNCAFVQASKSLLIEVVKLYNSGLTASNIAKKIGRDYSSILEYLYRADSLGLCKYYKNMHINNARNNFLLKEE